MAAGNQFFDNLPSLPGMGGGNPSGFNFSPSARNNMRLPFSGGSDIFFPGTGGTGTSSPSGPTFNWPGSSDPYQVPSQTQAPGANTMQATYSKKTPGYHQLGPMYPGLSNDWAGYLTSQIGSGVTPFDLSTMLPTGGRTQPGQLTAGANPLLQSLMQFYQSGGMQGGLPGMSTLEQFSKGNAGELSTIANQGVTALPAWQAMVNAQQQNIAQNQANLKEQFGSMGNLAGSPFGTAMSNYMQQTTADQNSLLGQLQLQGILQGQLPAATSLADLQAGTSQELAQGGGALSSYLQNLNQQAIQNQYGEFVRTSPQYNPLLQNITSMAQYTPTLYKTGSGGGVLGGLMSNAGLFAGMGGSIAEGLSGGGGITDVLSSLAGMFAA